MTNPKQLIISINVFANIISNILSRIKYPSNILNNFLAKIGNYLCGIDNNITYHNKKLFNNKSFLPAINGQTKLKDIIKKSIENRNNEVNSIYNEFKVFLHESVYDELIIRYQDSNKRFIYKKFCEIDPDMTCDNIDNMIDIDIDIKQITLFTDYGDIFVFKNNIFPHTAIKYIQDTTGFGINDLLYIDYIKGPKLRDNIWTLRPTHSF